MAATNFDTATWAILLDYHYYTAPVLLNAAVIHDLIEERPGTNLDEIRRLDDDAPEVLELVLEVTRAPEESKTVYLQRLGDSGSMRAQILKVADRIHNLTDLNTDVFDQRFIWSYLEETETFVLPMAKRVNKDMTLERNDLILKRWTYVGKWC